MINEELIKKYLYIVQHTNVASNLELLAEECTELAHAALKKARILRKENYTPDDITEVDKNLAEELSDVLLCSLIVGLEPNEDILEQKSKRWVERILSMEKD